jgi:hypothetical protein
MTGRRPAPVESLPPLHACGRSYLRNGGRMYGRNMAGLTIPTKVGLRSRGAVVMLAGDSDGLQGRKTRQQQRNEQCLAKRPTRAPTQLEF